MKKENRGTYLVTGVTVDGKRFRIETMHLVHAFGINLFRGSVWHVVDGRRKLIRRVYNV